MINYATSGDTVGARVWTPEGPYVAVGTGGGPGFKPGDTVVGAEGEWVFVLYDATAGQVQNQGDAVCWDNSYRATLTGVTAVANQYPLGMAVGTMYFGGRVGDPAAAPAAGVAFSYTFPTAGTYGIWVQRAGSSLLKTGTITTQATQPVTDNADTLMNGGIDFAAAQSKSNQLAIGTIASALTTLTFTATTVTGSAVLSVISSFQYLEVGMTLSGTGIPTAAVIKDIGNGTVTMSVVATANGTAVTITAKRGSMYATVDGTTAVLTAVTSITGFYPNQIVTGTGIASGSTIMKIQGNNAPWTVTLSLATTAAGTAINVTVATPTHAAPNYLEAMLRRPYFNSATSA